MFGWMCTLGVILIIWLALIKWPRQINKPSRHDRRAPWLCSAAWFDHLLKVQDVSYRTQIPFHYAGQRTAHLSWSQLHVRMQEELFSRTKLWINVTLLTEDEEKSFHISIVSWIFMLQVVNLWIVSEGSINTSARNKEGFWPVVLLRWEDQDVTWRFSSMLSSSSVYLLWSLTTTSL